MEFIIIFCAEYLFLVNVAILLFYFIHLWLQQKATFLSRFKLIAVTFPLIFLASRIAGYYIYDPRPFVLQHIHSLITHAADNGFPSDHMLLTTAIASAVFAYNRKLGVLLFVSALIVGVARVLALVHQPIDIIGSILIAMGVTKIILLIKFKHFSKSTQSLASIRTTRSK